MQAQNYSKSKAKKNAAGNTVGIDLQLSRANAHSSHSQLRTWNRRIFAVFCPGFLQLQRPVTPQTAQMHKADSKASSMVSSKA